MSPSKKFPWRYLVLAYGIAWSVWIPIALTRQDYTSSPLLVSLLLLGVFGPGIAGIGMTYVEQGKAGERDFWRRVFDWRLIRAAWYVPILLIPPGLQLVAYLANRLLGGTAPEWKFVLQLLSQPLATPAVVIIYTIQTALEELGWRGYMLDRLQAMWKPPGASLVLGLCHAFWHLPLFWVAGTNQSKWGFGLDFLLFVAVVIASSIYSTWIYNANGRSTLAVICFHTVGNLSLDVFLASALQQRVFDLLFVLSAVIVATSWTIRTGSQPFARQEARANDT